MEKPTRKTIGFVLTYDLFVNHCADPECLYGKDAIGFALLAANKNEDEDTGEIDYWTMEQTPSYCPYCGRELLVAGHSSSMRC